MGGVQNVARIRNAQFYCEPMPSGYTATIGCNNAALYIGGEGSESTRVFVNNCTFDAKTQPIVLRGSSGEKNNVLYISNSKLVSTKKIRIDSNHKVYLGIGNNFDATAANNPSKVTVTNNKYL